MNRARALDWPALMRAGMVGLRLTPEQFWRLTPAELRLMLNLDTHAEPMDRARLACLMEAFPDRVTDLNKGT